MERNVPLHENGLDRMRIGKFRAVMVSGALITHRPDVRQGETAWIELPLANGREPKLPAPIVTVGSKAP